MTNSIIISVEGNIGSGKSTLIKTMGYKKTLEFALKRKKLIIKRLNKYGSKSKKLAEITDFILDRSY